MGFFRFDKIDNCGENGTCYNTMVEKEQDSEMFRYGKINRQQHRELPHKFCDTGSTLLLADKITKGADSIF